MTPELGQLALILALLLALAQGVLPLIGAWRGNRALMAVARPAAAGQAVFVAFAFGILVWAFLHFDFSVQYVADNSNLELPWYYRIAAVWGAHEGSLLLWIFILNVWTVALAAFSYKLPEVFASRVLAVMGLIAVGFLAFIVFTSDPFGRLLPMPGDGADLNPVLQDPGMAFHPPVLYTGYVGFSVAFAFAIAGLLGGELEQAWVRWARPWTNVAWAFLTLGIVAGSWWAYAELGWGGWWFWDPVENASFMPWLVGAALIHAQAVTEKRGSLRAWTILLSIFAFSLSLLGTFLVRSGVLTSVHAFATDPTRGVFILAILVFFIGGALSLFAFRAATLKAGGLFAPISREGALVLNNLILTTAAATVLTGTLYPLVLEALTGEKISVGPPFFNLTFGLLMLPLLLAVPFGPLLAWKRGDVLAAGQRLFAAAGIGLVCAAVVLYIQNGGPVLAYFGLAIGFYMIAGAITDLWLRAGIGKVARHVAVLRFVGLPGSAFGTALAHIGIGVTVIGVIAVTAFETEHVVEMKPGMQVEAGGYTLTFDGMRRGQGPNYSEESGHFTVARGGVIVTDVWSSKRLYSARRMPTTEAGIRTFGLSQLYVSLGDAMADGGIVVRVWWKPMILCIWIGALIMMAGGIVSLCDRRLRVGAPQKVRKVKPALEAAE